MGLSHSSNGFSMVPHPCLVSKYRMNRNHIKYVAQCFLGSIEVGSDAFEFMVFVC